MTTSTMRVMYEVSQERVRQEATFGPQNHPDGTGNPEDLRNAITEKERCDAAHKAGTLTWYLILIEEVCEALAEVDFAKLRTELIQVAAVAVAWVEAIDRRTP